MNDLPERRMIRYHDELWVSAERYEAEVERLREALEDIATWRASRSAPALRNIAARALRG